jgi:hypothetical protein
MFCGDVRVEEWLQLATAGEEHVQTHEDLNESLGNPIEIL